MPRDTSHCTALLNLHCLDVGAVNVFAYGRTVKNHLTVKRH